MKVISWICWKVDRYYFNMKMSLSGQNYIIFSFFCLKIPHGVFETKKTPPNIVCPERLVAMSEYWWMISNVACSFSVFWKFSGQPSKPSFYFLIQHLLVFWRFPIKKHVRIQVDSVHFAFVWMTHHYLPCREWVMLISQRYVHTDSEPIRLLETPRSLSGYMLI